MLLSRAAYSPWLVLQSVLIIILFPLPAQSHMECLTFWPFDGLPLIIVIIYIEADSIINLNARALTISSVRVLATDLFYNILGI